MVLAQNDSNGLFRTPGYWNHIFYCATADAFHTILCASSLPYPWFRLLTDKHRKTDLAVFLRAQTGTLSFSGPSFCLFAQQDRGRQVLAPPIAPYVPVRYSALHNCTTISSLSKISARETSGKEALSWHSFPCLLSIWFRVLWDI